MIRHGGRELGPYSEPEVRRRLISETIKLADLGWCEGAFFLFEQFVSVLISACSGQSIEYWFGPIEHFALFQK